MPSSKLPWFRFYAADFTMDTLHLSAEHVGAYVLLLSKQWVDNTLPSDPRQLARIARVPPDRFEQDVWPDLQEYFVITDDGVMNERLERVRTAQDRARAERSRQAKKAARARWSKSNGDNNKDAASNAGAMPEQCSDDASQSQSRESERTHDPPGSAQTPRERRNGRRVEREVPQELLKNPWHRDADDRGERVSEALRVLVPPKKAAEYVRQVSKARAGPGRDRIYSVASDVLRMRREGDLDEALARASMVRAINESCPARGP